MKVSYFGYCIVESTSTKRMLFDIRPFLEQYCSFTRPQFKSHFKFHGENIYLFKEPNDIYLFVMTKDNEIIRKVDSQNISVSDLKKLLSNTEKLGFASYIIVKENCIGVASTTFAPKADYFSRYINLLFSRLHINNIYFTITPLMKGTQPSDINKLSTVGRTFIEVKLDHSLAKAALGALGYSQPSDYIDLESIEISFKPKRNKSIKQIAQDAVNLSTLSNTEKIVLRARDQLNSNMSDVYLFSEGQICDDVQKNKVKVTIHNQIEDKLKNNSDLDDKLTDYIQDPDFKIFDLTNVKKYENAATWMLLK